MRVSKEELKCQLEKLGVRVEGNYIKNVELKKILHHKYINKVESTKKTTYRVISDSMKSIHVFMSYLARANDFPNTYKIDSKIESCLLEFTTSLEFETIKNLLKKVPREGAAMLDSLKKK